MYPVYRSSRSSVREKMRYSLSSQMYVPCTFAGLAGGTYLLEEKVNIRHSLEKILSKYSAMQRLTLPTALSSTWSELVQELRKGDEEALPVVMFGK